MALNPCQSPEERGKAESNPPGRNWWKLACLIGLALAPVSFTAQRYIASQWIKHYTVDPSTVPAWFVPTLFVLTIAFWVSVGMFVIGGIGWMMRRR